MAELSQRNTESVQWHGYMGPSVESSIQLDGRIECRTADLVVMEGPKPKSIAEVGGNPTMFDRIRNRTPGEFSTSAFFGGATALLVPWRALTLLDERSMGLLATKYGIAQWPEEALIMLVRNSAAPTIQNAAEPAGGMAETTDLAIEQAKEIVEVGVYRDDGWVRFMLLGSLAQGQAAFDTEQQEAWRAVQPASVRAHTVTLEHLAIGQDILDNRHGIITVGPVGDFSFLSIARLHLEGTHWQLYDAECTLGNAEKGEPKWIALRRTVMVVVPRPGRSPIGFHFGEDGGLHPSGIHVPLSGEAWDLNLTHLGRAAIEAMGWEAPPVEDEVEP